MIKRIGIAGLLLLGGVCASHAEVLASYEFTECNLSDGANATGVNAWDLYTGGGFTLYDGSSQHQALTSPSLGLASGTDDDMAGAYADGQYFALTVTAVEGFSLDLESLSFDLSRFNNGCQDFAIYCSVDNYASPLVFENDYITVPSQTFTLNFATDVPALDFSDLTAVTFHIVIDDRVTDSLASAVTQLDNLILNGTATPPEGATLVLDVHTLAFDLIAPDTATGGAIAATYYAGSVTANDIQIVSLVASNGFSAAVADATLGLSDTEETITVTFDNTAGGLANGESTSSSLWIIWTEAASGVINTSEVALGATYINEPNDLQLDAESLSLVLNKSDASTNGTIVASYIEGTVPAHLEIVSVEADNGFSASPLGFTLNAADPSQDLIVTYTNSGALQEDEDTATSTLAITWTVQGSSETNTTYVALDVTFDDPPELVEEWTIGIDFGSTAPAGAATFNQISVGGTSTTEGLADQGVVTRSLLVDLDDAVVSGVGFSVLNASGQIAWDTSPGKTGDGRFITNSTVYGDALISNDSPSRPVEADTDMFVFTFTGLDDAMLYELSGGFDDNGVNNIYDAKWTADGQTFITSPQGDGDGYGILSELETDGSGNLVITVTGVGGDDESAHITVGALTLTAFTKVISEVGNVSIAMASGKVALSWEAESGASYGVQATDDLVSGTWSSIITGLEGIDGILSVTNDVAEGQQFFRPYLEN